MGAIDVPCNFVGRWPGTSHAWGNLRGKLGGLVKLFGDNHVAEFARRREEAMKILAFMGGLLLVKTEELSPSSWATSGWK